MFTGLIEHVGKIISIDKLRDGDARLVIDLGPLARGTKLGDSISVNGCCLTVVKFSKTKASFDAVPETLKRTSLGALKAGSPVNLERALLPGKRLGGHFVQGHVDGTATVAKTRIGRRWAEWHFTLDEPRLAEEIVEKGSITVDGISLTVAGCSMARVKSGKKRPATFWVALIPETLTRTTIASKQPGQRVNIETDMLGKYVVQLLKARLK